MRWLERRVAPTSGGISPPGTSDEQLHWQTAPKRSSLTGCARLSRVGDVLFGVHALPVNPYWIDDYSDPAIGHESRLKHL